MVKMASILLVEDEDQQREVLEMVFESHGYAIRSASSAEEAILHINKSVPDLIVSDVKLPGMDGFTLFDHVRSDAQSRDIPFVFITGYNDPKAIARVKSLGSVSYVTKPYDMETLIDAVKRYAPTPEM